MSSRVFNLNSDIVSIDDEECIYIYISFEDKIQFDRIIVDTRYKMNDKIFEAKFLS